jgi:hypothetical protein
MVASEKELASSPKDLAFFLRDLHETPAGAVIERLRRDLSGRTASVGTSSSMKRGRRTPCEVALRTAHWYRIAVVESQRKGGPPMSKSYEELLAEVRRLQDAGQLPVRPTREQRIDWAYGNTKIENSAVTREMAERAVDEKLAAGK